MKNIKKSISVFLLNIFAMLLVGCGVLEQYFEPYIVTDISQYRTIPGTGLYSKVKKYSNLVMPKEIEDFFIVEKYSLMYDVWDDIHEEYLEVIIEDETQYQEYINGMIGDKETEVFFYDETYQEYVVNDIIDLTTSADGNKGILFAEIQKILFSDSMNKIIFLSLAIPNAYGPVDSDRFCYFEKFNIDPTTYYDGERIKGGYEM